MRLGLSPLPPSPAAGVRVRVGSVQPGADSPGEGPVRRHRDRGLRAAGDAAQRESASGMTPHPPALRRTLGGAGPPGTAGLSAKPLPLQVAMLKYGELASTYRASSLPGFLMRPLPTAGPQTEGTATVAHTSESVRAPFLCSVW